MSDETPKPKWTDERIDSIMGLLLRAGVLLSAAVVLAGGVLYLRQHASEPTDLSQFRGQPPYLDNPIGIVNDAFNGDGESLIQLGILLLIATPVARVMFSVFAFILQRDVFYVMATLLVLSILLYGLFAG